MTTYDTGRRGDDRMVALTDQIDALETDLASVQRKCVVHQREAERQRGLAEAATGTTAHLHQRLAERAERRAGLELVTVNRLLARREQLAAEVLGVVGGAPAGDPDADGRPNGQLNVDPDGDPGVGVHA
ncbi:MAG TPA: hypothetical protein VFL94_13035 [Actinomycetales bacterium]|nr:hypothetical protein [Actinomycetales bacterium]